MTVLMTPRAVMKPASAGDLETLSALWNEPAVRELLFDGDPVGPAQARRLLDAGLAEAETGLGWWLVTPWSATSATGCVGLLPSRVAALAFGTPGAAVETLIAFGPQAWARGHAHEAVTALVRHALHDLALPRLGVLSGVPDPMFDALLRQLGFEPRLEADTGRQRHRQRLYELTALMRSPRSVATVQDRTHASMARRPA